MTKKGKTDVDYLKARQHAYAQKINVIGRQAIAKHKDQTYFLHSQLNRKFPAKPINRCALIQMPNQD